MVERLKAALERARSERDRRDVASTDRTETGPATLPARPDMDWNVIPEAVIAPERLQDARISTMSNSGSDASGFDALQVRLHRLSVQKRWRRFALTAPMRGCGVTTFALNLAFSFARHTNANVLLVDLNFRAPAIAVRLGLRRNTSLASVLSGESADEKLLSRFGDSLLIAADQNMIQPSDSLQRDAWISLFLNRLEARFKPDIMLLDLPSVLGDVACEPLLGIADAALLVALAGKTTAPDLDESARRIAEATSYLGAALNQSNDRSTRSMQRELV